MVKLVLKIFNRLFYHFNYSYLEKFYSVEFYLDHLLRTILGIDF